MDSKSFKARHEASTNKRMQAAAIAIKVLLRRGIEARESDAYRALTATQAATDEAESRCDDEAYRRGAEDELTAAELLAAKYGVNAQQD